MELYFARHGQSENNILPFEALNQRSEDPELTATGRKQAGYLARFLSISHSSRNGRDGRDPHNSSGFGLTHLYASLMVRALATGTAVAEAVGLPLNAWEDLHEEGGIFLEDPETREYIGQPGRPRGYFTQSYPHLVLPESLEASRGWWNRPFETEEERNLRARRLLHDLLQKHPPEGSDRVLVVSHAGFYNRLMHALLYNPAQNPLAEVAIKPWFELQNAALTRIDFRPDRAVVVYCNRTDYLPADMITG